MSAPKRYDQGEDRNIRETPDGGYVLFADFDLATKARDGVFSQITENLTAEKERLLQDYDRLAAQLKLCEQHAHTMATDFDASIEAVKSDRDAWKSKCEHFKNALQATHESDMRLIDRTVKAESELIDERDEAQQALSQIYYIVFGQSAEWSNLYGIENAVEDITDSVNALKVGNLRIVAESKAHRTEVLAPSPSLLCKLASIAVHADEMLCPMGHGFDKLALQSAIGDPEVVEWIKQMTAMAMAPVKRS